MAFWEPFNLGYVGECARLEPREVPRKFMRRSREEATDKLRKELAEFEKKLAEARAEAAKPDEPRPSYLSGPRWDDYWPRKCEQERQKARAHVAYYEQRVEIARYRGRMTQGGAHNGASTKLPWNAPRQWNVAPHRTPAASYSSEVKETVRAAASDA